MYDRPLPLQTQWIDSDPGLHWRVLSVAIVPVALIAFAFALAASPAKKPVEPVVAPVPRGDKLVDRFVEPPAIVQVRTIPIVLDPAPQPPSSSPPAPVAAAEPAQVPGSAHVHQHNDVCQRHGMRKVMTRGGRSWRCRR